MLLHKSKIYGNFITGELKAQITSSVIKLGTSKAIHLWSTRLGKTIAESIVRGWHREQLSETGSQDCNTFLPDIFYIINTPIENCPCCDTKLVPQQFTVNITTALMKTICCCGLHIEISI